MEWFTSTYNTTVESGLLKFTGPYREVSADLSISGLYLLDTTQVFKPLISDTLEIYGQITEEYKTKNWEKVDKT